MHVEHVAVEKVLAFSSSIESEVILRIRQALLRLERSVVFLEDLSSLRFDGCYFCYRTALIFTDDIKNKVSSAITRASHSVLEDLCLDGFSIEIVRC